MPSILKKLDWPLMSSMFFIMLVSSISLLSSSPAKLRQQLVWYLIGAIIFFLILKINWKPITNYWGVIVGIYFFVILLLVVTYFFAPSIRGTRSWLQIGGFQFQPSELAKLALILLFAKFFSRKHISIARVSNLLSSFIYLVIPLALVAIQPDFGSGLILFFIWFGFLLVSGIKWRHLVIALIIFLIFGAVLWVKVLKDYQKERIMVFLFPNRDPLGINYSTIQAKIAIGSAGLFGQGFKQGTQVQLGFLPEVQTDFILAAFIEEWGILLGVLLISVFFIMVTRIIKIGLEVENNFDRLFCLGTAILFVVQFAFNAGSNLGLMPVIGVTFPFLSYGGSSLLTDFILVGMVESIAAQRAF
ncbi:MAG: FtsW/RodA/SpoVE family cell cycle protein [Candidatus Paceibacterota bacterium]|jgi:rod shape determining protein RodA